jgi:hypothetical protein
MFWIINCANGKVKDRMNRNTARGIMDPINIRNIYIGEYALPVNDES